MDLFQSVVATSFALGNLWEGDASNGPLQTESATISALVSKVTEVGIQISFSKK